jgi:transglutaminase-like putative cysteine protease
VSYLKLRRLAPGIFFLFFLSAPLFSGAQTQPRVEPWKSPHFSIDPQALYQAASVVAASDNADVAILEDDASYSFDEAGRSVRTEYVIYKVLTQKGAEGWDSVAVDWEPWHQARPRIQARVIARDLSVHTLDAKQITEAPAREGEYKTYGDGKTLRAPFPAIAPGVVVEEEFVIAETVPFFAPGNVGRVFFGRAGVPVAHSVAEFDAPASLPLRTDTVLLHDLKPQRTEANGRLKLVYEQGLMDPLSPPEPNLPLDVPHFPAVEFSTGASWQAMATEYGKIVDSHANQASVQAIVDQLVTGKTTAADKEQAIVDYLDREIRYTGIEFDEAAIIPHDPAETLAHKYGDCKDKATLLVTMLRAAGIPAYVALLNAGSRMDVPADLPGMGLFDHAIVYVPGPPALWIDATDPYARLGQLPAPDQGRLALIARPETTALAKTPESTSKDNVLLELRELTLAENGPASVVEVSRPTGVFEGEFRDFYADKPDKDTREALTGYVKAQYSSDKLTKAERTDPTDLSRQFELTLACEKARRAYTDLDSAVAAIRVDSLFQRLPAGLQRKDDTEEKKDEKDQQKKPRTADWELPQAFTAEWRYRIVPPAGFVPKPLPKDAQIPMGPALLTEEFSAEKDGTVLAHLTFDSVKQRYTVAEATALRDKVAELVNGPAILVNFEPQAEALLREGKVREALASDRSLVALHPNEAVHHLQVAQVLLDAGMGEAARTEARLGVKLEPNSALPEKTLAQILKRDLAGRNLRAGSDMDGAAEAYRAAIKLDPDDRSTQGDLAILLEYDSVGRRYGHQAKMKEAIAEYEKLGQDKLTQLGLANNLVFALFYGGDYAGAFKTAQALNPEPKPLIAASVAMLQGSQAGLAEANKLSNDDDAYKETARVAGEMLMNVRQYQAAADFLQAGAAGDNAAQTMGLANMLRGAQHHEDLHFGNTPQDLVKRVLLLGMDSDLTEAKLIAFSSRNAVAVMKKEDPDDMKKALESGRKLNIQLARQGSSMNVTIDLLMQALDPKGDGSDATGYREKVSIPGGQNSTYFVVREDGQYKLLDTNDKPNAIALEMLDRIKAGNLRGAKVLLDWLREDRHMEGGDDPLGGPVFPRFWMKGEAADARRMKLAAAALLAESKPTAAQGVALLEEARKSAATEHERTNIDLALSEGYAAQDNFKRLYEVSSELLKQVPESKLAFTETMDALLGLGRYDEATHVADERLKLLENDADAFRAKMTIESTRGNYAGARAWARKLVDQGNEDAEVLNSIAWLALFTGKVEQADIATAIKATQTSRDNPAILHTLACLYAQAGKAKEAHDLLLRGMDELNLVEPDDDYWYAFGLIAEQYGENEIAIADYRKLSKPKEPLALPTSSYKLAQTRLKALGSDAGAAGR